MECSSLVGEVGESFDESFVRFFLRKPSEGIRSGARELSLWLDCAGGTVCFVSGTRAGCGQGLVGCEWPVLLRQLRPARPKGLIGQGCKSTLKPP